MSMILWERRRSRIGYFLEDVYNGRQLYSAIGYVPPQSLSSRFFDHDLLNSLYRTKGSLHTFLPR